MTRNPNFKGTPLGLFDI